MPEATLEATMGTVIITITATILVVVAGPAV
jgi:hypothetical protein